MDGLEEARKRMAQEEPGFSPSYEKEVFIDGTCNGLASAVRLLIQGAQEELTSRHAIPQPNASIMVLGTIIREVDDHLDLPPHVVNNFTDAIAKELEQR